MRARIISIDEKRLTWKGRALGAFAVVAALGVGGWQFAKWWENPIEHEGVKLSDNHVTIGDKKVSDPFAVMMENWGVRNEEEARVIGTQTFADALKKTEEQVPETTSQELTYEEERNVSECRKQRQFREHYVAWQARTENNYDSFLNFQAVSQQESITGLDDEHYNALLIEQGRDIMSRLWEKQQDSTLSPLERYVMLRQIGNISFTLIGRMNVTDEISADYIKLGQRVGTEQYGIRPLAMRQLVDEWQKIPKPINATSDAAKKLLDVGDVAAYFPHIRDVAGENVAESLMTDYKALQRHHWDQKKRPQAEDYSCAGVLRP